MLRLVYYDNSIKPRIWIRSPGTSKELANSIDDFVPIYSGTRQTIFYFGSLNQLLGQPNAKVTETLARKMKEAKMFEPINAKLKEHQEIMERLSRL